ncbi:MAG: hypothetical protein ACOX6U_07980 [Oscillospiraceae bacterium]|jgi:hypothetical protein
MEVIPSRMLNGLYIWLDIAFLCFLFILLLVRKKYTAALFGLFGGILYFVVDYGGFYMLLHTRVVTGADPFWFLLWLSISYGFTNFVWIWLWLDRDKHIFEWSVIIVSGWFASALLSQNFGGGFGEISISRGTGSYHGVMAAILFVGYAILCVYNMRVPKEQRAPLGWILAIGVLVQFAWEFVLLISGIRAQGIAPLIVNSLLETNLGLPYIYFIHKAVTKRRNEDLSRAAV